MYYLVFNTASRKCNGLPSIRKITKPITELIKTKDFVESSSKLIPKIDGAQNCDVIAPIIIISTDINLRVKFTFSDILSPPFN